MSGDTAVPSQVQTQPPGVTVVTTVSPELV